MVGRRRGQGTLVRHRGHRAPDKHFDPRTDSRRSGIAEHACLHDSAIVES
jgi:hypothetical protein